MGVHSFIIDINECAGRNACDDNADCVDSDGSYWCQCLPGFQGDGYNCTGSGANEDYDTPLLSNLQLQT